MTGLYPIIRRQRVPLIVEEPAAAVAVPVAVAPPEEPARKRSEPEEPAEGEGRDEP